MIRYGLQWQALQDYFAIEETANSSVWGENAGGTPPDNHVFIYAKDKAGTSALYWKNDAGTEFDLSTMVGGSGASGRVAFWPGTSTISSNAAFLWDNTNKRLGINVSSNTLSFEVECESTTDGPQYTRYGSGGGALWTMRGATNTQASPGQVSADLLLGGMGGQGRDNASNWSANVAVVAFKASQAFTSSARGTYITLETTINGATTRTEKVRIDNAGVVIVGGGATQIGASAPTLECHPLVGNAGTAVVYSMGFGSGNFGNFQGRAARGTSGSPTATQSDDVVARFSGIGYGATAYAGSFRAAMSHFAAENWSDSAQGAYTEFATTPTGSTTSAVRFRIGPAGQWGVGGATYGSSGNIFKSGGASAAPSWGTINLLDSSSVGDTLTGTVVRGDVIIGNSTPKWSRLARGSSGAFLRNDGSDVQWSTLILPNSATANRIAYATSSNTLGESANLAYDGTDFLLGSGTRARMSGQNRFRHLNTMVRVTKSGNQSINSATATAVTWDTEDYDTDTLHDTSSNTSRLTAAIAGKYIVFGVAQWASDAGGGLTKMVGFYFYKNGSLLNLGNFIPNGTGVNGTICTGAIVVSLAASDYMEMFAYQESGGALNFLGGSVNSTFGMVYLGE